MMTAFRGRAIELGARVAVYRNLHAHGEGQRWSIVQSGRVVAHTDSVTLSDVAFRVSAAGLARAKRLGRKVVCAFVVGFIGSGETPCVVGVPIVLDPNVGAFVTREGRAAVQSSSVAHLTPAGLFIPFGAT